LEIKLIQAKESLQRAQERQVKYANRKRRHEEYQVNELMMLSTINLKPTVYISQESRKLQPKFIGPFKIKKVVSATAYELDLPHTIRVHPVFHISLLKRYIDSPIEFCRPHNIPATITMEDGSEEFEVEAIRGKRIRNKQVQYLIKWKGYPEYDSTWEPVANLKHAKTMIHKFENSRRCS